MLSGRRAFHGDTAMDAMTAILKDDPPELPAAERQIPPALVRIVERCLEKSPAARFQSTRDLAFALEALSTVHSSGTAEALVGITEKPRGRERTAWTIAAVLGVVALASLASTVRSVSSARSSVEPQPIQFMVSPPEGWSTRTTTGGARDLAMSPDGRRLAFIAADTDGRTMAWVRVARRHGRAAAEGHGERGLSLLVARQQIPGVRGGRKAQEDRCGRWTA